MRPVSAGSAGTRRSPCTCRPRSWRAPIPGPSPIPSPDQARRTPGGTPPAWPSGLTHSLPISVLSRDPGDTMPFRHLRPGIALIFFVLAAVAGAGTGARRAAKVSSPSPSVRIGIKLLEVPSSQAGNPRDERYIVDNPAPGAVIARKFEVVNLGSGPLRGTVYPAAATISGGAFRFAGG